MRNTLVLTIIIVGFGSEGQGSALLGKDSDSVMNGNSKFLECGEQMGMRSVPTSQPTLPAKPSNRTIGALPDM